MKSNKHPLTIIPLFTLLLAAGCGESELTKMSRRYAHLQAESNRQITEFQTEHDKNLSENHPNVFHIFPLWEVELHQRTSCLAS